MNTQTPPLTNVQRTVEIVPAPGHVPLDASPEPGAVKRANALVTSLRQLRVEQPDKPVFEFTPGEGEADRAMCIAVVDAWLAGLLNIYRWREVDGTARGMAIGLPECDPTANR